MSDLVNIAFHGHALSTADIEGTPHVAMRPIVEAIGLGWQSQYNRIKRHPVLSEGVFMMNTPSNGGTQKMLMIPLSMLNGWLFGVDVNRVKPEIRDTLIMYQRECFQVLADYWLKGEAINPRALTLTPAQQCHVKQLVRETVHRTGQAYQKVYTTLNDQFMVGTYKDIPASRYPEVCRYLNGEPLEGELLEPEMPQLDTQRYSYPMATAKPAGMGSRRQTWLTADELLSPLYGCPVDKLLTQLSDDGFDVAGCRKEYKALKLVAWQMQRLAEDMAKLSDDTRRCGLNVVFD